MRVVWIARTDRFQERPQVAVSEPYDFGRSFRPPVGPRWERAASAVTLSWAAATVPVVITVGLRDEHGAKVHLSAGLLVFLAGGLVALGILALAGVRRAFGLVRAGLEWLGRDRLELCGPTTVLDYLTAAGLSHDIHEAREAIPWELRREVLMATRHAVWIYAWWLSERHSAMALYQDHLGGRPAASAEGRTADLAEKAQKCADAADATLAELGALAHAVGATDDPWAQPTTRWEPERWHAVHMICDRIAVHEMQLVRHLDGTTSTWLGTSQSGAVAQGAEDAHSADPGPGGSRL